LLTPPSEITDVLAASETGDDEGRFWQALDIPKDSRRFQYPKWLQESGADLMYAGNEKIIGFDGIFPVAHGNSSTNWDDWDGLIPEQVRLAVDAVDWTRRAAEAQLHGEPAPPAPKPGGVFSSAAQLDSREQGDPTVNLLTRDQSVTWFFKTREGAMGVMQLVSFTDDPPAAKIRYKLIQQTNDQGIVSPAVADEISGGVLANRLEAASMMNDPDAKDRSLSALATDAAKAGNLKMTADALQQINDFGMRNRTAQEAVRSLAKRGLRKQALEIAKSIDDLATRDKALSELAQ
jgi:hypothetical protein